MQVRDATDSDAAGLAALMTELGYPIPELETAERLARFAAHPASRVMVAELDGNVIGLVATHIVPRLDNDALSCRVTDIVVTETSRRKGVGSALIAAAGGHGASRRILIMAASSSTLDGD